MSVKEIENVMSTLQACMPQLALLEIFSFRVFESLSTNHASIALGVSLLAWSTNGVFTGLSAC